MATPYGARPECAQILGNIDRRDEYESLRETAYLLRNPANARRLLGAIDRLEAGDGSAYDLAE